MLVDGKLFVLTYECGGLCYWMYDHSMMLMMMLDSIQDD